MSDIVMNQKISISNNMLFRLNDIKDLQTKIEIIMRLSVEEITKLQNKGYSFVKRNYSLSKMINRYKKLLSRDKNEI